MEIPGNWFTQGLWGPVVLEMEEPWGSGGLEVGVG